MLEEYDWSAFAVITSLHPGHALFLEGVRAVTDASYLSWRLLDVLTLELGPGGARQHTQRLLRQLQTGGDFYDQYTTKYSAGLPFDRLCLTLCALNACMGPMCGWRFFCC